MNTTLNIIKQNYFFYLHIQYICEYNIPEIQFLYLLFSHKKIVYSFKGKFKFNNFPFLRHKHGKMSNVTGTSVWYLKLVRQHMMRSQFGLSSNVCQFEITVWIIIHILSINIKICFIWLQYRILKWLVIYSTLNQQLSWQHSFACLPFLIIFFHF